MRRTLRENKNGDYNLYWETEIEGIASTDFFKDAEKFQLGVIVLINFRNQRFIRLHGLQPAERGSTYESTGMPLSAIFVAKEVQI